MADLGVLSQIPGLAGYLQTKRMNEAQSAQNMQGAVGQMGLLAQIQARQEDAALKGALASSGGDLTKAMQAAITSGNLGGAAKLAPLLKLQQERQLGEQMSGLTGSNLSADALEAMALKAMPSSPTAAANLMRLSEAKRAKEANTGNLGMMRQQVSPITEVPQMGTGVSGAVAERANLNIPEPAQGAIPPEVQAAMESGKPFSYGIGQSSNPMENVQLTGGALAPLMQSKNQVIAQRAKNLQEMINQPNFQGDVSKINTEIDNLVKLDAAANRGGASAAPIAVVGPDGKPTYVSREQAIGMAPAPKGSIAGEGVLTPEALTVTARQYLAGDRQAVQGFARNATARIALQNAIVDEAAKQGMTPEGIAAKIAEFAGTVAGSRTVGQRGANIALAATEAQEMLGIVKETSDKFSRTNFMPWNMVLKAYDTGTGSPEIAAFGASLNALVNVYARAINPTGVPTVSDKEHARAVLNAVQSPQQVDAVMAIIRRELEIAKKAPQTVREATRAAITGGQPNVGMPDMNAIDAEIARRRGTR